MKNFSLRLKELREIKGLSQQTIAEQFALSQQSVYKYEHGMTEPDISMLKDMAEFFDVSVDYLIGYSDIPFHYEKIKPDSLTHPEIQLLERYRSLSPEAQAAVLTLLHEFRET